MATMDDLDALALAMPETMKEISSDWRPEYRVHEKMFVRHRRRRSDAADAVSGELLDDVLIFRVTDLDVKELLLHDGRGIYFTTPHFDGYPAVLVRIAELRRLERDEIRELVVEAWLSRAQKRLAKAWLNEYSLPD
jgi:hypothetical protein